MVVFCFFNFRKWAKCFAGDVGAVSIAFVLLFLLGKLVVMLGYFRFRPYGYWYLGAMVLVLGAIYVVFMRKYYRLHEEALRRIH